VTFCQKDGIEKDLPIVDGVLPFLAAVAAPFYHVL